MTTRRSFAALTGIASVAGLHLQQEATPQPSNDDPLVRYVEEVLEAGNTDVIPELVTEDVVIADSTIVGIEAFTWRAVEIFARRQRFYDDVTYEIVSSARQLPWTFAYVRISGTDTASGETLDVPILLAAELQDNLIETLVHITGDPENNP